MFRYNLSGPIFEHQAVQENFLNCLALEEWTDRLSRNVGKYIYQSTLCNVPKDRRSYLHNDGSLKSRVRSLFVPPNIDSNLH